MSEDIYGRAKRLLETEKYKLAAASLHHYLKLYNEQLTIETITEGIRETLEAETYGETRNLNEQLVKQSNTLDALFDYLLQYSNGKYAEAEWIELALRAQRQAMMTTSKYRAIQHQTTKKFQTD